MFYFHAHNGGISQLQNANVTRKASWSSVPLSAPSGPFSASSRKWRHRCPGSLPLSFSPACCPAQWRFPSVLLQRCSAPPKEGCRSTGSPSWPSVWIGWGTSCQQALRDRATQRNGSGWQREAPSCLLTEKGAFQFSWCNQAMVLLVIFSVFN